MTKRSFTMYTKGDGDENVEDIRNTRNRCIIGSNYLLYIIEAEMKVECCPGPQAHLLRNTLLILILDRVCE